MATVRPSKEALAKARRKTDWRRLDGLTDKAIGRAMADDSDAAPDLSDELQRGAFRRIDPLPLAGNRGTRPPSSAAAHAH